MSTADRWGWGLMFAGSIWLAGYIGALIQDRRYRKADTPTPPLPAPIELMDCPYCTWVAVGAAEAFTHHLATDHVRDVVGEVGE